MTRRRTVLGIGIVLLALQLGLRPRRAPGRQPRRPARPHRHAGRCHHVRREGQRLHDRRRPGRQVRVIFYRDDIFRIWLGPDGDVHRGAARPARRADGGLRRPADRRRRGATRATTTGSQTRSACCASTRSRSRFALFDQRQRRGRLAGDQAAQLRPVDARRRSRRGETRELLRRRHAERLLLAPRHVGEHPAQHPRLGRRHDAQPGAVLHEHGRLRRLPQHHGARAATTSSSPLALAHDETRFDAYYFYGPSLKKILDGYTLVTGRPFFPPRWGLEFGDADCYNKTGKTSDVIAKVADAVPRERHARRLDPAQRRLRLRLPGPRPDHRRNCTSAASTPGCGPRRAWTGSRTRSAVAARA